MELSTRRPLAFLLVLSASLGLALGLESSLITMRALTRDVKEIRMAVQEMVENARDTQPIWRFLAKVGNTASVLSFYIPKTD